VQTQALYRALKIVSSVVLVVMIAAIGYASIVGITYWSGIGV
jgi:hypothetical protein